MKIVHIMLERGWGGAEVLFRDCCVEMSERGHDILAVVRTNSLTYKNFSSRSNTFSVVPVRRFFHKYRWWTLHKIRRIFDEFDPDIVVTHIEGATLFISKLQITSLRRWPLVAFVPFPLCQKNSKFVDTIIPHTQSQADTSYHVDLVDPHFSDVVPVFSRFSPVARVERKTRIQNLIAVGRLVSIKGFNFLIDAMHELKKSGYNLRLNIVGGGSEMESLVQQRDALGLKDVIQFQGETFQVHRLMQQAQLFVLPSVEEPFGIVLLEAMALGLPIVATKSNGPMELFDDSSAVLVNKNSGIALSEGIQLAIKDLDATYNRACNALNKFKECYSAEVVIPKYIEVFERCIDERIQTTDQSHKET